MKNPTEEIQKTSALERAWENGEQLQYFQALGYDSEWTDYTQNIRPDFNAEHLRWRVRP